MKRFFALLLAALAALATLAGCAAFGGGDAGAPAATLPPAPSAAPQSLRIGGDAVPGAARAALAAYGDALGVQCTFAPGSSDADLLLLSAAPTDGQAGAYLDMATQPLLAAAAARAGHSASGPAYALPVGRSLYGYWADGALLTALLGEGCLADVQNASWTEWSAFATALQKWLDAPGQAAVTLNGQAYTLPAEKPAQAAGLVGVFGVPRDAGAWAGAGAAYTAPLLAAGDGPDAAALEGPLGGLCGAFLLELANAAPAGDTAAQLEGGQVLFARSTLADLAAACTPAFCQRLVCVPFKGDYTAADLASGEYNLNGLMDYPTLAGAGYLAIPAGADAASAEAAAAAILWLYGSAEGESALTDQLLLITPWDTAANTTAVGAAQVAQVEAGILPGAELDAATAAALAQAWQGLAGLESPASPTAAERRAYREAALAALLPPASPGTDAGPGAAPAG